MAKDYSYMDQWDDEEIAKFKEEGTENELNLIQIDSGILKILSEETKIVSEGDSWFDYLPGTDIIDCLRKHHDYYIKNYGNAGDTLENMIYGNGFNHNYQRTKPSIGKVLKELGKLKPKVFLFSGGGNDIAGDGFGSFLNHNESNLPDMREVYLEYMINVVFKKYFEDLIEKVSIVSPQTNILAHGYGYTYPTGKGVSFLFFTFTGPWLLPALAMKGIYDPIKQRAAVNRMIDSYNEMLIGLEKESSKFHHIDLRNVLDPANDWANELHLKNSAYAKAADEIHEFIVNL